MALRDGDDRGADQHPGGAQLRHRISVGDRVIYTASGQNVLQGGAGRVVNVGDQVAVVEVETPTTVCNQPIKAGERFNFLIARLRVVEEVSA